MLTKKNFYDVEALLVDTTKYAPVIIDGVKVAIDHEMAFMIEYFNSHGVHTLACCQGIDLSHLNQGHGMVSYILFDLPLEAIPALYQFYLQNQEMMETESVDNMYILAAKASLVSDNKKAYLIEQTQNNTHFKNLLTQFVLEDCLCLNNDCGHQKKYLKINKKM